MMDLRSSIHYLLSAIYSEKILLHPTKLYVIRQRCYTPYFHIDLKSIIYYLFRKDFTSSCKTLFDTVAVLCAVFPYRSQIYYLLSIQKRFTSSCKTLCVTIAVLCVAFSEICLLRRSKRK
jgi:hypothetical protein